MGRLYEENKKLGARRENSLKRVGSKKRRTQIAKFEIRDPLIDGAIEFVLKTPALVVAKANNTDIFSINPDSPQEINLDELVRIRLCAKSTLALAIKESGDDDDLHNEKAS